MEGAKIVEICEKGDKFLEEEIAKVYKGKKITKGLFARPVKPNFTDCPSARMLVLDLVPIFPGIR